jgi:RNA polymerase sigma-70 factor, ECF subfamily
VAKDTKGVASSDLSGVLAAPQLPPASPRLCPEPVAFTDVFRGHFDFVWRAMRSFGVPELAIDDAVQDVFISVHRRLPDFEGRSSLSTWIYGIAYHTAQNYRRGARRREALPLETDLVSSAPGPGEQLANAEAGRFVLACLDRMAPERRDVFVLCVLEELTAPDVAEILQVKLNTVYSRLRLARADFRSMLGQFARSAEERT